jgi:hypothetical protein
MFYDWFYAPCNVLKVNVLIALNGYIDRRSFMVVSSRHVYFHVYRNIVIQGWRGLVA